MTRPCLIPAALLLSLAPLSAAAQTPEAPPVADPSPATTLDAITVTGTRASNRTALKSAVPVEVISAQRLQQTGFTDLARALQFAEPSLNFPRAQTTPTAANTRAITLRGLSPDEVLVLINGKRAHGSAVINVNFAVGRGSAPFDLATIPLVAIERVEVLRDGAAAQYGSDAIAGVVNIILKSRADEGIASLGLGITERGDGEAANGAASRGFTLPGGGRLVLSGELDFKNQTNRAELDQRLGRVSYRIGDPEATAINAVLSAALPVSAVAGEVYGDLLLSRKQSSNAVGFRLPGSSPLYPDGFLPLVTPTILNLDQTLGLRGALPYDLRYDAATTLGYSSAEFAVRDTANTSLGAASPTRFDAGTANYLQSTTGFTLSRALPELLAGGNLSLGLEYRVEQYELQPGEPASISGTGASGFPGFNPRIPVDDSRDAQGVFVDLELRPLAWLSLGAAARLDHYSDFGEAQTYKLSSRAEATSWLALRGSHSTGFRAPSLQQQFYSSITTVANGPNRTLVNVGTFQVADPVAQALGAEPLRAETSFNSSIGLVFTPLRQLSVTVDFFRTQINDRIALSNALSGAAVTAALNNAGITNTQQAAFFTNALDTRTQGFDFTLKHRAKLSEQLRLSTTLGFERAVTRVREQRQNRVLPALPLIGVQPRLLLTEAQPNSKLTAGFTLSRAPVDVTLAITRFGSYRSAPIRDPQTFGAKTLVDLSAQAALTRTLSLSLGVLNVGDTYPDDLAQQELAFAAFGGSYRYGEESPFGTQGRAYFAQLWLDLAR